MKITNVDQRSHLADLYAHRSGETHTETHCQWRMAEVIRLEYQPESISSGDGPTKSLGLARFTRSITRIRVLATAGNSALIKQAVNYSRSMEAFISLAKPAAVRRLSAGIAGGDPKSQPLNGHLQPTADVGVSLYLVQRFFLSKPSRNLAPTQGGCGLALAANSFPYRVAGQLRCRCRKR